MKLFSNQSPVQGILRTRRARAGVALLSLLCLPSFSLFAQPVITAPATSITVPSANRGPVSFAADQVIIKFNENVSASQKQLLLDSIGLEAVPGKELGPQLGLYRKAGLDVEAVLTTLQASDAVEYAQPNYTFTAISTTPASNDPDLLQQWNLDSITATSAWGEEAGAPVIVAVIDAGIDYTHPDLAANMWVNPGEIPDDGLDNDGNGFIDDVYGYDFAEDSTDGDAGEDGDPMDDELAYHGTAVAGVIAAVRDNTNQIAGVTSKVRIMALRAAKRDMLDGVETILTRTTEISQCIDYAIANGAQIISIRAKT
jgi:subtilisin family serine protease